MTFPTVHIIHNNDRDERYSRLMNNLKDQGITDFKIWDAIIDRARATGISRAHKQIVRWAKEQDLDEVTIFEDDIRFGAHDGFKYYLENKPDTDWDIYLGGCYIPYFAGEQFKSKLQGFIGFHLYTVRKKFYDTYLGVPENIDIDRALNGEGNYEICYPYAAIQYNGWSDNSRKICNYDMLLIGKEIHGMETITEP